MEEIAAGPGLWIAEILALNLALMLAWAGGLHPFLFTYGKQGEFLRFSVNTLERHTKFTFGDQEFPGPWCAYAGMPRVFIRNPSLSRQAGFTRQDPKSPPEPPACPAGPKRSRRDECRPRRDRGR